MTRILSICVMLAVLAGCQNAQADHSTDKKQPTMTQTTDTSDVLVDIKTSMGDIRVRLFGDTPRHRDNFVKLVNEGYYNGVLFHRVINEFMIQTGDPDSKDAPAGKMLGSGGPGYTLEAEINYPKHFHQRGALAAARQGDQVNPERRSSGSQFYIVTGRTASENELNMMERQLKQAQMQGIFQKLASERRDEIMKYQSERNFAALDSLKQELIAITESTAAQDTTPMLNQEQRKAYSTVGGAPHLDGQYTVFGQVESGMDVVDRIEKVATDPNDRPKDDVRIISMSIVKE